jgi:hypothetical protein
VAVWPANSRVTFTIRPSGNSSAVVMDVRIFQINLAKPCHLVIYADLTEKAERTLVSDIVVER